MPEYEHICTDCNHEWNDVYSIKADPPKNCPSCGKETAMRLISGGSGKGIVEPNSSEIDALIKKGVQDIKKKASVSESYLDNLVGGDKVHQNTVLREKMASEFKGSFRRSK